MKSLRNYHIPKGTEMYTKSVKMAWDASMANPMDPKVKMICMENPMDISMAKAMKLLI